MSEKKQKSEKKDIFAEIAAFKVEEAGQGLVEHFPPELPDVNLPLDSTTSDGFVPMEKIETANQLSLELERCRGKYKGFLENHAPELASTRITETVSRFDWRIETECDREDFSGVLNGDGEWEQVDIPHYGAPLGKATTYYRTTFNLTDEMMKKESLFVHFKAVDYKAHVFVNDSFLGSHEGFFAPFEFDFTAHSKLGENTLVVKVDNDAICMGNDSWGDNGSELDGDKIYAATGLGYDDPEIGWHHCPPGMGIYQDVTVEARSKLFIHDIFVRPLVDLKNADVSCRTSAKAEAWFEIWNCDAFRHDFDLSFSIFGQNFNKKVLTDSACRIPGPLGPGVNYVRTEFEIPDARLWELESPWLYQIQVKLNDKNGELLDTSRGQFGMRSFTMDEESEPKGRMYLNNEEIRLRGANTMGHLQQCVAKRDWQQLIDDILLAKICNMNFLRLTQRPVQPEIYEYCDRLGLMTQTDLPLFGVLRRNQFCEAIRQAEEMERLVRSHPCNIMDSYINEPFPNAQGKGHRHLLRDELERFFEAATHAIMINNPDRVIKNVDGDYDPPAEGLPDNHCYNGWYNGHGLDIGKLHKGFWQKTKPGWMYGCGEFGAEGLEDENVMREYYPKDWLPQSTEEDADWFPDRIVKAQTGNFHYMWFQTQKRLEDWIRASQEHQRWADGLMTEAFRRDANMNTIAIHLFIDAFPAGWMKTIMDVERQPKPAYFAYRDALTPLMVNLRSDRRTFYSSEKMAVEAWICNDTNQIPQGALLCYQLEVNGNIIQTGSSNPEILKCAPKYQGEISFSAPEVNERAGATIRLALIDNNERILHEASLSMDVFPLPEKSSAKRCYIIGSREGKAAQLAKELSLSAVSPGEIDKDDVILIDDFKLYEKRREEIGKAVNDGAHAIFLELEDGEYKINDNKIEVMKCGMSEWHFVSIDSGHEMIRKYKENDFKFWYDSTLGYPAPIIGATFTGDDTWIPILKTGNGQWGCDNWAPALAVAERPSGKGKFFVCQLKLTGRTTGNPIAESFARGLMNRG